MLTFALAFYLPVILVSYAILLWRHGWDLFVPAPGWVEYSLVAVGVALVVVLLSRWFGSRFEWAREMEGEFMNVLGPLTAFEVTVLAVISGIGEEAFFRGVLQPKLGLAITSLLFGAVHVPFSPKLVPWTIFAIAMGVVLGALLDMSGSLIPPIITHALINGINLMALSIKARELGIPRRTFVPPPPPPPPPSWPPDDEDDDPRA